MRKLLPEAVVFCAIIMVVGYGFAQAWRQTDSPHRVPVSIAESADGRIIMAVGSGTIVVSTNSGNTWATNAVSSYGSCVALSADGTKMVGAFYVQLAGYYVFVSTNSGNTWTQTSLPQGTWDSCASSADGTKLIAAIDGGLIYTSTNSGATWQSNTAPIKSWTSLASSIDGIKLAAAAYSDLIYASTNSGLTWKPTSAPNNFWRSIASSANGKILAATGSSDTYISTNFGGSWNKVSIVGNKIATSADGSKLIISSSQIYTSTNFGITWTSTNIPGKTWYSVASSADGCQLLAGENNTGVWIYQVTPSPKLSLKLSNNNLALSWPVPSTNFELQQNADFTTTNWVALTNAFALNLTNLNYEVTLSPSNGSGFFRLATPP